MSDKHDGDSRLEMAIASVYGGRLEDFVRRRDSLAKELRSAGNREAATTVKGLRKPSRTAWALNLGTLASSNAIEPLVNAVAETLVAQTTGGDARTALGGLRGAVREFASLAAKGAEQAGYRIESGVLANAVLAVIGRPESFHQLRGGYLADIPEAGGLDVLAGLATPSVASPASGTQRDPAAASVSSAQSRLETAARAAAREAASALADARSRSQLAQRALRDAVSKLKAAEDRARLADEEARSARDQLERARQEAEAAAEQQLEAENAAADAERQLEDASRNARVD